MRKSAYQLGQEARERNTNCDLNPFEDLSDRADEWFDGWVDKDLDLWEKSGLTPEQWDIYCKRTLK